jgi:DNA-binding XRE family transcriptional regulator
LALATAKKIWSKALVVTNNRLNSWQQKIRAYDTYRPWTHCHHIYNNRYIMNDRRIKKTFGNAVREARLRANMSQEALAESAGLDRTYIGGVERGERNPSLVALKKIAAGLGVTLSDLFAEMQGLENRGK